MTEAIGRSDNANTESQTVTVNTGRAALVGTVAVLFATGLAACGSTSASTHSSTPTTIATVCVFESPSPCIQADDNGKTLHTTVGSTIRLHLGQSREKFSPIAVIGNHSLRVISPPTVDGGIIHETLVAEKPGRTVLQATIAPVCTPGTACPQYIILWRMTIVVTR